MIDPQPLAQTVAEWSSAAKDLSITAILIYAIRGVLTGVWVPGAIYKDQLARAEKAEAHAALAHDAADRATRVSEQLVQVVQTVQMRGNHS